MAALSEQQKYLLNRLPNRYAIKNSEVVETAEVKQARKVIAAFQEKVNKKNEERKNKFYKALSTAREAVYFKPPGDALRMVRELETEFPDTANTK